mmetsp:Transcript_61287/g.138709  ORF Transcript_61287/g.138709 Transcript_61287/m.138709 type:complete len:237 (+) Transcript_61287:1833-2543(+)
MDLLVESRRRCGLPLRCCLGVEGGLESLGLEGFVPTFRVLTSCSGVPGIPTIISGATRSRTSRSHRPSLKSWCSHSMPEWNSPQRSKTACAESASKSAKASSAFSSCPGSANALYANGPAATSNSDTAWLNVSMTSASSESANPAKLAMVGPAWPAAPASFIGRNAFLRLPWSLATMLAKSKDAKAGRRIQPSWDKSKPWTAHLAARVGTCSCKQLQRASALALSARSSRHHKSDG